MSDYAVPVDQLRTWVKRVAREAPGWQAGMLPFLDDPQIFTLRRPDPHAELHGQNQDALIGMARHLDAYDAGLRNPRLG